jgi:hypothetical protein
MPAISLHKQMAMGKGYPTAKKVSSDPSPTPGLPSADYKTKAKATYEAMQGEGNGGTNSQRGRGPNQISTVMGGR